MTTTCGDVDNAQRITQTAMFDPVGLFGLLYWYAVWPLHELVFRGIARVAAQWPHAPAARA